MRRTLTHSSDHTSHAHTPTSTLFFFIAIAALLAAAALLPGCNKPANSAQSAGADSAQTGDLSAVALYNTRHYQEALTKAEAEIPTSKGRDREVNLLTAGLSAYALNQPAMAQHYLESLPGSADPQIAGRAEAVLAQIADKNGNHQYAADLYQRASTKLDGDDAARASVRAGNSARVAPRSAWDSDATRSVAVPMQADSLAVKQTATKLGQPGPFTIQVGAYTSRASADKRLKEMTPLAAKAGLSAPKIVPELVAGRPGYAVQVGSFAVKQAATAAKSRLGNGQYMVVSAAN